MDIKSTSLGQTHLIQNRGQNNQGVQKSENDSYNDFKDYLEDEKLDDLKISQHAAKRMAERELTLDGDEFVKLRKAVSKLKDKGSKDSLVITNKGAYIIDVEKNTMVTAMDKKNVADNIFTKIDSTMIVD